MTAALAAETIARAERRAAEDPRFVGVLLELVEAPTSAAGSFSRTASAALNHQRRDEAREQFLSGALATSEVQRLLGLRTPQAVHRLRSRGKLLGRQIGNATWFPAWQFCDGERRADLDEILEMVTQFTADAMAADRIMRLRRDELGGRSIAEALDRPRQRPTARVLLASLGR